MNGTNSRSLLDRIVGAALGLLVAAVAVYAAVRLIQAVMTGLLIIGGIALLAGIPVMVWKSRRRGW